MSTTDPPYRLVPLTAWALAEDKLNELVERGYRLIGVIGATGNVALLERTSSPKTGFSLRRWITALVALHAHLGQGHPQAVAEAVRHADLLLQELAGAQPGEPS